MRSKVFGLVLLCASWTAAQEPVLQQGSLTASGSAPFHLKATIYEEQDPIGKVEIFWTGPKQWRRTIASSDFTQTMVVNGDKVYENDSDRYLPLAYQSLLTAMIDPQSLLSRWQPGELAITKENGRAHEDGTTCFGDMGRTICMQNMFGLSESVDLAGHRMQFTAYKEFEGKRIARRLNFTIGAGEFYAAEVTELEKLEMVDEKMFVIDSPTPEEQRLNVVEVTEPELREHAVQPLEVIWPQVLDGNQTGTTSYLLSIDTTGNVREVLPLDVNFERSSDSARRQIARWQFKPLVVNGVPAQMAGVLRFAVNTRQYGPKDPLSESETRKHASKIVEPKLPKGASMKLAIAVDADGIVIEKIVIGGEVGVDGAQFAKVDKALQQWKFEPLMENGQPRPFRGELEFRGQ